MARALIVGCGCRGRAVGKRLLAEGWQVRGTSRRDEGLAAIEAAGIESAAADPTRPDTVLELVGDVTVVAWLLASAQGSDEELAAIHGPRLDRLMEKLVETPVRGFVYEAAGSVDPILLARGRDAVDAAAETWRIPLGTLLSDPADHATWADPVDVWLESATNAILGIASQSR
jgi:uncharacterized protein YbjT (DUF2867 family)